MPFVLFDYTENAYEIDITTFIPFFEYTVEQIDSILSTGIQAVGYGSPNSIVIIQGILLGIILTLLQFIIGATIIIILNCWRTRKQSLSNLGRNFIGSIVAIM